MASACIGHAILKAVVFDVDVIASGDDSMKSLPVGAPQVVVVDLLGIEANATRKPKCFKNLVGQRAKKYADVGEGLERGVGLLEVAKVSGHPGC